MTAIRTITHIRPTHTNKTSQVLQAAEQYWFPQIPAEVARVAGRIMESADIDQRCSVMPLDVVFGDLSFEEKNNLYITSSKQLAKAALEKALVQSQLEARDIDFIISTSCTGFMIPSVDAYVVDELNMKQDIVRLPVTEMGCAGGTSALIYAHNFLRANPNKRAAIIAVETPSLTFQKYDYSMENIVSTAIFADGVSCLILEGEELTKQIPSAKYHIEDYTMYHFPKALHLMGYQLQNSGLKIVLDRDVPNQIQEHLPNIFKSFTQKKNLGIEDIQHFYLHPGGKKIIAQAEKLLAGFGKDVELSKGVLKNRGNMSSATILHILESAIEQHQLGERVIRPGDHAYMLAFGPGFSAHSLLLRWS